MRKPRRVLIIDPENREVSEGVVTDLDSMQEIVGGWIERAIILPNGDEIYVNEEGLFNSELFPFYVRGGHQPFMGKAFVIGKVSGSGNNGPAQSTVEELKSIVWWGI